MILFLDVFACIFVLVRGSPAPRPQLQEAKQLERDRHRQHSEPESPQLQTPVHPPTKPHAQEANGPISPPTPSIAFPSTPATESASGEQGEQEGVYENPDPENGSEFCVAENEQTEADQATAAAAQSKTFSPVEYEVLSDWSFKQNLTFT